MQKVRLKMNNTGCFNGKTVFITGGSRGIGFAIAKKLAADNANITLVARTAVSDDPEQPTIFSAAAEIEKVGGKCLPYQANVKNEDEVRAAIEKTVETFGGIDIVINNCSHLNMTGFHQTNLQNYDSMFYTIPRAVFLISKLSYPYLKKSEHAHILNLSPPVNKDPIWLERHMAYTAFKYSVSMYTIGMSLEFKEDNIAVNSLWPKTVIYATGMKELGGTKARKFCRSVSIMADAAYAILSKEPKTFTGNLKLDEEVLLNEGITDFDQYKEVENTDVDILPDLFVKDAPDFSLIDKLG